MSIKPKTTKLEKKVKASPQKPTPKLGKKLIKLLHKHPLYRHIFSARDAKSRAGFALSGGDSLARKYAPMEDYVQLKSSGDEMASSLVDPKATYQFRLAQSLTLATGSAGSLALSIEWDPAVIGGSDWSAVTTLFNQVRLVRAKIHLVSVNFALSSQCCQAVGICSNISAYAGVPSSITSVVTQPDAIMMTQIGYGDPTNSMKTFTSPTRPNSLWAPVGTPAPGIDQGCYGTFWLCHDSLTYAVPSLRVYSGFVELVVEVRGRA